MDTYYIIDSLGQRKAVIKAASNAGAIKNYMGGDDYPKDSVLRSHIIAILKRDFEIFKKQVSEL